jgi:hypothetical protein
MIRYLYLYADGKIGASAFEPTEIDMRHVSTGWLRIVKLSAHLHDNAGGTFPVPDYVRIGVDGVQHAIPQCVRDDRTPTPFHYVPEPPV